MSIRLTAILVLFLTSIGIAPAQELEGDYLYKVSTIRAAPGSLSDLLDWIDALETANYFEDAGEPVPLIMRHSQGDQWDLMIVTPMESWIVHHSESLAMKRNRATEKHEKLLTQAADLIAFDEDVFAYGPPFSTVGSAYADNNFYHIEMFEAAPGKVGDLLEQRQMENEYLAATGQTPNMIFSRAAGSDVDIFTIGFHKSLEAFAAPAPVSDEQKEVAAKDAGFEDRADISFYLRSLISGHHDTLATKVE